MKFFIVTTITSDWFCVLKIQDNRGIVYLLVGSVAIGMIIRYIAKGFGVTIGDLFKFTEY